MPEDGRFEISAIAGPVANAATAKSTHSSFFMTSSPNAFAKFLPYNFRDIYATYPHESSSHRLLSTTSSTQYRRTEHATHNPSGRGERSACVSRPVAFSAAAAGAMRAS